MIKMIQSIVETMNGFKPYSAVIFLQFGIAGLAVIAKFALNQGMNHYAFVVYRHAIATIVITPFALVLERKVRPKMTPSVFVQIILLGLLEPVIDQNLYYAGMKYTTATFVTALSNILPALTFILAWIFRLEKVNLRKVHSLAKLGGTVVTVAGATIMTLVKGPVIKTAWSNRNITHSAASGLSQQDPIKGAIMVSAGCACWAGFVILQAMTLKSYPAEISLTALICLAGTIEGGLVAAVMEWGNTSIWTLQFDAKLLAYAYSGIMCSGIAYCIQGMIMKEKGPVFVTAFSPFSMIIVALIGLFILSEQLSTGRIIGGIAIIIGVYLVVWGKLEDDKPSNSEQVIPIQSPQSEQEEEHVKEPSTIKNNSNNRLVMEIETI